MCTRCVYKHTLARCVDAHLSVFRNQGIQLNHTRGSILDETKHYTLQQSIKSPPQAYYVPPSKMDHLPDQTKLYTVKELNEVIRKNNSESRRQDLLT